MAEILGQGLNLRLYESPRGFDVPGLFADLKYFIREHGPSVVKAVLPLFPRDALTLLQYAPDAFSYHLIDNYLVATEDLKQGRITDVRSRIDQNEPRRGQAAYLVMEEIAAALADENHVPDGKIFLWLSPKEGFSPHSYINIGTVGRDSDGRRLLSGFHYMSDFDQSTLLRLVRNLSGIDIPEDTDSRLVSRALFSANSVDIVTICRRVLGENCSIDGISISRLWGEESKNVWSAIRRAVKGGEREILDVIASAKEKIVRMQTGLAQIVFGLIESVLGEVGGWQPIDFRRPVNEQSLMSAFATVVAGCVGIGSLGLNQIGTAEVAIGIGDQNWVYCPVCDPNKEKGKVYCPPGHTCPRPRCGAFRQCG